MVKERPNLSHLVRFFAPIVDPLYFLIMAIGLTFVDPMKQKRYVNKKNLELIRSLPCSICYTEPSEADHIRTRGAGGGDNLGNLQPLCRKCHVERHTIGIETFYKRYDEKIKNFREDFKLPPVQLKFMAH